MAMEEIQISLPVCKTWQRKLKAVEKEEKHKAEESI